MRSRTSLWPTLVLAVVLAWPGALEAQFNDPPGPAAYALQNVTVVSADGSRTDSLTLVILRRAELGFLGVIVLTCKHTPRFCGQRSKTGALLNLRGFLRRLRTS